MPGSDSIPPYLWVCGQIILVTVASYAAGCLATGYYLVRWRTGLDIRMMGSGNIGAKNVNRILGKTGFLITFSGDFIKGLCAVGTVRFLQLPLWAMTLALLAVVAGHNWPIQLGFQGGKGISTSLGAVLAYDPFVTACYVGIFLITMVLLRRFTLSGLVAYVVLPIVILAFAISPIVVIGMILLAVEIIFAHRQNLRNEFLRLNTCEQDRNQKRVMS